MYCKGLTKQQLSDWGIIAIIYDPINNEWQIFRHWYKNNSKQKILTIIKPSLAVGKHKYRPDKEYLKVSFSVRGEGSYSIPLSRLVYTWYNGDIPDGYVVDHADNNSFNNNPKNLQLFTVEENLAKRYIDNPEAWTNQWGKQKGYEKTK